MVQAPDYYYRTSDSSNPPIRVGLLLGSATQIPAYVAKIIDDIRSSNFARIVLLISKAGPLAEASDRKRNSAWLYRLYRQMDARMQPANDPFTPVDASGLLADVESLAISPGNDVHSPLSEAARDEIRAANFDLLLQFGFEEYNPELLSVTRFGLWSFLHGDLENVPGERTGLSELIKNSPTCTVALQARISQEKQSLTLGQNVFATERTLSVSRSRFVPYWGSTDLVIRKLNELHRFGWDYLRSRATPSLSGAKKADADESPGNLAIASWLAPVLAKKIVRYPFRKEIVPHWRIAVRSGHTPLFEAQSDSDLDGFRWIEAPPGHCWADPFVFEHEGKVWSFFEDYSYQKRRAALACAEVSPEGKFGPSTTCLEHSSDHYSYPHVFRARSDIFMIPESFDSNAVDLFRCERFPDQWVHEKRLFEGKFVDTTVWEHEGLWWLATTSAAPVPGAGSLLLFYADEVQGPWHFHPENPISTDIRVNRGAGKVFRSGQRLIRPSQSGAPHYGYSLTFLEITELSVHHYAERSFKTITPDHWKGTSGVHTYNCGAGFEVIDGQTPMPLNRVLPSKS